MSVSVYVTAVAKKTYGIEFNVRTIVYATVCARCYMKIVNKIEFYSKRNASSKQRIASNKMIQPNGSVTQPAYE